MINIILSLSLLVCTKGVAYAPVPIDVQALNQKNHEESASAKYIKRYNADSSFRVGQKVAFAPKVDATTTNCQQLTAFFEKKYGIPQHLLLAICRVESRCRPWAVYCNGASKHFRTRKQALDYVRSSSGNIQVGCMQIDIRSHQQNFKSLEAMITPYYNVEFSAKLLKRLYKRYKSWERAVAFYNAASPVAQARYCKLVSRQLAYLRGYKKTLKGNAWV